MESKSLVDKITTASAEIRSLNEKKRELAINGASEFECDILEDQLIAAEKHLEELKEKYADLLLLEEYQKDCNHIVVQDLVDLTPDRSATIYYCSRCLVSFDFP